MKRNTITAIADIEFRPPEAGRIRLGTSVPGARPGLKKPVKLKTFRFTSRQADLIHTLAGLYGGTVQPWNDQWEVTSVVSEIPVILFAEGLGQDYEMWDGGALLRRCDGVECMLPTPVSDYDYEMLPNPCICGVQGFRECALKTRLQVFLPLLALHGTWRVETGGFNAAAELPGMFDMITRIQSSGGMVNALLGMEERTKIVTTAKGKQTRKFIVPKLGVANTPTELAAGAANLGALNAGGSTVITPALPSAPRSPADGTGSAWTDGNDAAIEDAVLRNQELSDDDIDDAELVDDELLELERQIIECGQYFGVDGNRLAGAIALACTPIDGPEELVGIINRDRMRTYITKMNAGEIAPMGFRADGRIQWKT